MANATKKPSDVVALAELFETLVGRADDPEVQNLFELIGISNSMVDAHRARMDKVEHYKGLARRLNEYESARAKAKQALQSALIAKETIEKRIADTTSQLTTLNSVNPPTGETSTQIASLAPLLASDQNKLVDIEHEVSLRTSELTLAETNLTSSKWALAELGKPTMLPLAVQLSLRQSRSTRQSTDDRLTKVQQLLTLGRAALRIEARDYNVRAGDRPAVGAMNEFYRLGGVPMVFVSPTVFNESGSLPHGSGLWTPFVQELNRMLAEVRISVSALEVEESKLLAAAASGFDDDRTAIEAVYVDDLRKELSLV